MIFSDKHIHTDLSFDGKDTIYAFIKKALSIGLKTIGFCEHVELDKRYAFGVHFPPVEKLNELKKIREEYSEKLKILFGLEVSYLPSLHEKICSCIDDSWDFVVGSVHIIELDGNIFDISYQEDASKVFKDYPLKRIVDTVVATTQSLVCSGLFSRIGHIDMIKRFFPVDRLSELWKVLENGEVFRPALQAACERGLSLEINSSGMRHGHGEMYPCEEIVSIWKEVGGRSVDFGSDAHSVDDLGSGREEVEILIKKYDFIY